ncbi:hypothetical protein EW146_g8559 [Bondarzewia mesenterica]|uniref:Uncharacterized protein n=1 Tax=Bondarzewia mesenterica TaxID=1095465 RepID=A0A4S4LDF4_9AGAM|nr:hypothetical protein EW146_g8559 [Bondarzewia mesenterica]
MNRILRLSELAEEPEETFTSEQRREHCIFQTLLQMVLRLEERLMEGSDEDIVGIAELIQKGASSARANDTKSIKGLVLDWITPKGEVLNPPIGRNVKIDRGFNHNVTRSLLCPAGLEWKNPEDTYDPEEPWKGLFRSQLLISAFKHVFTSPSSVEKEVKATRSGNARIHGMICVTLASIAYIATQVRSTPFLFSSLIPIKQAQVWFALSSLAVFSRTDTVTDSEHFYNSVLDLFDDAKERKEVEALVV